MKKSIIIFLLAILSVGVGQAQTPEQAESCKATITFLGKDMWSFKFTNRCGYPVALKLDILENKSVGVFLWHSVDAVKYQNGETAEYIIKSKKFGKTRYLRAIWYVQTYSGTRKLKRFEVYSDYGKSSFWNPVYDSAGGTESDW